MLEGFEKLVLVHSSEQMIVGGEGAWREKTLAYLWVLAPLPSSSFAASFEGVDGEINLLFWYKGG